ncbi:MAG TPA: DsbA family oxidoreductase [Gemmatimonadaceae bacterium]|nr:DsbA family oxidoreductase [Gemmatimonadaceae bacterium]
MKVEVWSDVMCPFCYLGKRRFAKALGDFADRADVEVIWKSFQLNPSLETDPGISVTQYLAREKGLDVRVAEQMNDRVARMARQDGPIYNFDEVVVANTFDAHRLIHFARSQGLQDQAIEKLFSAYFTEGRNVDDRATLIELGREIGLDGDAVAAMLDSETYAAEVNADIEEARDLGINGVPFFVFDRAYVVSGAQDAEVFADALDRSLTHWRVHPGPDVPSRVTISEDDVSR